MSANGSDQFETLQEVGSVPTSVGAKLVARLVSVRGHKCGDLRLYATNSAGESVPTRRGLCIGVKCLGDLAALAAKLAAAAGSEVKEEDQDAEQDADQSAGENPGQGTAQDAGGPAV